AAENSNSILGKLGGIFAINGGAVAKDVLNSLAPIFFF
ncbi:hypothetical protein Pgy4_40420, partial [Pseudomonas savastanoi pv. glycinea str. race 4]